MRLGNGWRQGVRMGAEILQGDYERGVTFDAALAKQ